MFDVRYVGEQIYPGDDGRSKESMSTSRVIQFELTGADGGPLRGTVRTAGDGTGRPPIVICHGFKGAQDWGMIPVLAERIARAGMTAVTFNFSGSGVGADGVGFSEPERFARSTFSNDVTDIDTVCRSLLAGELVAGLVRPVSYGLFGYSRGGGAAVLHAAEERPVRTLVTWAAIAHTNRWDAETLAKWRTEGRRLVADNEARDGLFFYTDMLDDIENNGNSLDVIAAAGRVRAPWLILHGGEDAFVPVEEGVALHDAANRAQTELEVLRGGTHSLGALPGTDGDPGLLKGAVDRTLAWFSKYMY